MSSHEFTNASLEELDRNAVFHPLTDLKGHAAGETPSPRIMERAKGVHVIRNTGEYYLDGFAGLYCVNAGYGQSEIAEAIAQQARKMAYYHIYAGTSNEPAILVANRLLRMAPEGMSKVYFGLSGSDANETQVKIVWYVNNVLGRPKKKKIISRHRAYHGSTVLAGSLTGVEVFHRGFDLPVGPVLHTTAAHHFWEAEQGMSEAEFSRKCAEDLDQMITRAGPETVAAFIAEPMMGSGGIVPPPDGYWSAVQPVLKKHDVLLIADEVVCGFGRLGSDFGSLLYDIKPDLMTVAKGLTSAYAPLSAVLVGERVWSILEQGSAKFGPFGHGYTYAGHPLGVAAAQANLDVIERQGLVQNAFQVGSHFIARLHEVFDGHPLVGEVRGEGLLAAIELLADRTAKKRFDPNHRVGARLAQLCFERGLIARAMPGGDILGFAPPLCITRDQIDELIEMTNSALTDLTDQLTREGVAP